MKIDFFCLKSKKDPMECIVCCESIEIFAKYTCEHILCYKCASKLLFLYGDNKCPLCKKENKKPFFQSIKNNEVNMKLSSRESIVDEANYKNDLDLDNKGEKYNSKIFIDNKNLDNTTQLNKSDITLERDLKNEKNFNRNLLEDQKAIYSSKEIQKQVNSLLKNKCKICNSIFTSKKELALHFKNIHSFLLCQVCLNHNHQFWYEIIPYTYEQLNLHKKGSLNEPGFFGHVYCPHCSIYLYSLDEAKKHCNLTHQLCTVCESLGNRLQFYNNYEDLEKHYHSQHFCCNDALCIKNLCYVFAHKSELWAHCIKQHSMDIEISDLVLSRTPNPTVCSLSNKNEQQIQNELYRQSTIITNPQISIPFFPVFSKQSITESKKRSSELIPEFLDRRNMKESNQIDESKLKQIKCITPIFYKEIFNSIKNYLEGIKTLEEIVKEMEESIGNKLTLQILENISFESKSKEVKEFSVRYKKQVMFPVFKKNSSETNIAKNKKSESIGFKVLDFSKKNSK